jgi:transcriptional regulator with XRE-family HTH domain
MTIELFFAKVLKSMRIKRKMSQEELAFRSDLDRTYISMLERGIHQPTLSTLFALSRALNMKPSEMIKLVETEMDEVDERE